MNDQLVRKLTAEQIRELEQGNGVYYVTQERAFAPGVADGWPAFIPAPHTKNGRLVRRVVQESTSTNATPNPGESPHAD